MMFIDPIIADCARAWKERYGVLGQLLNYDMTLS